MRVWRRVVFRAQWVPPFVFPVWYIAAPGGFDPGYSGYLWFLFAPIGCLAWLAPALLTGTGAVARRTRLVPLPYALGTIVAWPIAAVAPLTFAGAGDIELPSLLDRATGVQIGWQTAGVTLLVWVVLVVLASLRDRVARQWAAVPDPRPVR